MFFFGFGGQMAKVRKVGEWSETIPEIKKRIQKHEFAGLVGNIVSDIGPSHVIDLGCGEGRLSQVFAKNDYLGLDIDEKIINVAKTQFSDYAFLVPDDSIFSTDMCIASRVFLEITEKKIHEILTRMRCKWLLVAEPLASQEQGNVLSFNQRSREDYIAMMRAHDLLLFKHMVKTVTNETKEDVSFLLFKKCERNPVS
ncbi:MAG: hypothetical protein S4CHLAM20_05900 [Chlamydiia bacterium]|nr:hypothetical protein [Chlamydiia bacterium]